MRFATANRNLERSKSKKANAKFFIWSAPNEKLGLLPVKKGLSANGKGYFYSCGQTWEPIPTVGIRLITNGNEGLPH